MSTFKECLKDDLKTFISLEEFADIHNLDGTECAAIVQEPTVRDNFFLNSQGLDGYTGIQGKVVHVHCQTSDLPELPGNGEVFKLDGEIFIVESCTEEAGITTLELHADMR